MPIKRTTSKQKPAVKQEVRPKSKVKSEPKVIMYASKKLSMYHPYMNVRFLPGVPTACEKDVWLEAQIAAGLIEER